MAEERQSVQDWLKGKMIMGKEGIGGTVQGQMPSDIDGPIISIGLVRFVRGGGIGSRNNKQIRLSYVILLQQVIVAPICISCVLLKVIMSQQSLRITTISV